MYALNTLTETLAHNLWLEASEMNEAIDQNIIESESSDYCIAEMLGRLNRLTRATDYLEARLSRSELN